MSQEPHGPKVDLESLHALEIRTLRAYRGREAIRIGLVSREEIEDPYAVTVIKVKEKNSTINILIFLIGFYFLIIILIIVKNLVQRRTRIKS